MGSGAHVSVGGVWTNASSRSLKENISELSLDQAFSALKELNPVTYNYKNQKEETYAGFIAEDVPELVATPGRKGVSALDMVAVLTKVVQEQQRALEQLKEEMADLRRRID